MVCEHARGCRYLNITVTHALRMAVLDGIQQLAQVKAGGVAPKPVTKACA